MWYRLQQCHSRECPTVSPRAITRAREEGYDSIQILRHWMDGNCDRPPIYEILDLREPYIMRPLDGTLLNGHDLARTLTQSSRSPSPSRSRAHPHYTLTVTPSPTLTLNDNPRPYPRPHTPTPTPSPSSPHSPSPSH